MRMKTEVRESETFPSILNDIHLCLTPKTLLAHCHSSNSYGEEYVKCVWISSSHEGRVMKNYGIVHHIYRIQDDFN